MNKPLNRPLPATLFKYRAPATDQDFDRIKDMIALGKYFCSSPKAFNDVFDCKPVLSFEVTDEEYISGYIKLARKHKDPRPNAALAREARGYIGTDIDPRSEAFTQHAQNQLHEATNKFGVFCLAESPTNILMWAHYAASYTGICIEIETRKFRNISPVGYSEERLPIKWQEDSTLTERARKGIYTKSSHWSYEDEWRVLDDANKNVEIGPGSVKRIIFGPNCKAPTIERIVKMVKSEGGYIILQQAVPNRRIFEIDLIDFKT